MCAMCAMCFNPSHPLTQPQYELNINLTEVGFDMKTPTSEEYFS